MADALQKRLGLGLLTAYGVGVMVGAGIYVLVGVAAGQAGVWAPISFLFAALVAIPTALSFSELSARIPEAAGDSSYVEKGLNQHWLAVVGGLINIVAGTVASAAVLRGGVGYLTSIAPIGFEVAVIGLGIFLTIIALLGVLESLAFAAILTVIEVFGLMMIIWVGFQATPTQDWITPPAIAWSGVMAASIFAFFAFIGFDDLVNMAEEAKAPERNMPRSILLSLLITTGLYILVSTAAVRTVPSEVLATSERPLALVWEVATGKSAVFLSAIAVAAALNGVLAQIVMASRVMFGLGRRSPSFAIFHHTSARFGTPVLATVIVGAVVIISALTLPVAVLAQYTTLALLVVFTIVNAALIGLKTKGGPPLLSVPFSVPVLVPWLGILASIAMFAANFVGPL